MSLEQTITKDIITAMKAKDKVSLRSLRAIKSAIMLLKTDGSGNEITEETEIKLLQKMMKQRKESLAIYTEQGRSDLAATEEEEISVISKYLPEQMGEEELKKLIQGIVQETGAEGMKDMGKVMGIANKTLAGKAEGKMIASVVKGLLAG